MKRGGAWVVAGAVSAIQALRLLYFARLPERELIQRIPDDAFYYLVLAKNFATTGRWTFDGTEPATGFQLLWGYLLAGIYRVAPGTGLRGVFAAAGVLQLLAMSAAVWVACRTARSIYGAGAEAGVAVIALAAVSLMMGTAMMETSLVLLLSAVTLEQMTAEDEFGVWGSFALGVIGTLVRVDFVLLPLCLLAMQTVMRRGRLRQAVAVCGGALAGVGLVALHTHAISGQWLQASVRMKLQWQAVPSLGPVRLILAQFFDPTSFAPERIVARHGVHAAVSLFMGGLIALVVVALVRRREQALTTAGVCAVMVAYAALYRTNSAAMQQWYIGPFEMPLALLMGGAFSFYIARARVAALAVCGMLCAAGACNSLAPSYYWQQSMYDAAIYMQQHPELAPIGAWNAGLMGFFNPGKVVNLDGLVNDSILQYVQRGRLVDYVAQRQLRTIFDYPMMFSPILTQRGRYEDGSLRRCLTEVPWTSSDTSGLQRLSLYRVDAECAPKP